MKARAMVLVTVMMLAVGCGGGSTETSAAPEEEGATRSEITAPEETTARTETTMQEATVEETTAAAVTGEEAYEETAVGNAAQYPQSPELSPEEKATLDVGECQLQEAQQDLGPEGYAALEEEFVSAFTADPEGSPTIQDFMAERGYTCDGRYAP